MTRESKICFLLTLLLFLSSCGQLERPPYKTQLRSFFSEMKATFVSVEEQMREDSLVLLNSSLIDGTERKRQLPLQSPLTESQRSRYREILGDRDAFNFMVEPSEFTASVYIPPARGNDYTFWFVRTNEPENLVQCNSETMAAMCGGCSIAIDSEWHMSWSWFPIDPDEMDESCSFLKDDI